MKLMREIVRNKEYPRTAVQAVFHFIDYLLKLPKDLEQQLAEAMYPILGEEKKLMELYNKENASPTIANAFEMERVEGRMEERLHLVQNMLKKDWSLEDIMDVTELSEEKNASIACSYNFSNCSEDRTSCKSRFSSKAPKAKSKVNVSSLPDKNKPERQFLLPAFFYLEVPFILPCQNSRTLSQYSCPSNSSFICLKIPVSTAAKTI